MKIFRQNTVNTQALDQTYDRVGSVSPLKFRPKIDLDGLQEEDYYERKHSYERKKMQTPDPIASYRASPERSTGSISRNGFEARN